MKVLIIGSGGREHALCWKFSLSEQVEEVFVAPGNSGMKDVATIVPISIIDNQKLIAFVKENHIDLTVVGPETALANGIVDDFKAHNLKIFGPSKEAALIESSKHFAKELMKKYQIPTAKYETFTDYEKALTYIKEQGYPIVVKADGLAQGKGVVIVQNEIEAKDCLREMLIENKFNCDKVVIEEFLEGEEFSLMAFVNNEKVYPMVISQDHKRAYDNDLGPNTGGMGAYSPVKQISDDIVSEAVNKIMIPCAKALVLENKSFTGVLYGGLIVTNEGPKVIEFNARFGDPETEVVLPRLKNDLFTLINDLLDDKEVKIEWDDKKTLGVVLASKGYPGNYDKGFIIKDLNKLENVLIFHMGTKLEDGLFKTNGGRVLFVVAKEDSMQQAQTKVYEEIKKINCDNLFYRTDIGHKTLGGNND